METIESNNNSITSSLDGNVIHSAFIDEIKMLIDQSRRQAYAAVNQLMVETYWNIGKRIVEEEQKGQLRAEYGKHLLQLLSDALTAEFGRGWSTNQLYYFRQFYILFEGKFPTACGILTWSHYKRLLSVPNQEAREWYMHEAAEQIWSLATLNRNISTQYYERMLLSQVKAPVEAEMKALTKDFDQDKLEFIKNPVVAEFLGMSPTQSFVESELETAILNNLQKFLLELGKGFSFVDRQKLVRTPKNKYYIDLVFYNFKLKCFVLIDLKVGKVTYEDAGQMQMYVKMYDQKVRCEGDNPTLGIILCSETDEDVAQYTLNDVDNVHMAKYLLYLPSKEDLRKEIEAQKAIFSLQQGNDAKDAEI